MLSVNSGRIADLQLEVSAHGSMSEMSIFMYIELHFAITELFVG